MANATAKTSANIFYKARCEASAHNEQLSNREGTADIMSIDRGRLYRIENEIAIPYPEEIKMMADLYRKPELRNYYCRVLCPLGKDIPKVEPDDLYKITVKAIASFRNINVITDGLLNIVEDGIISETEKPELTLIMKNLDAIALNLKVWAMKNLN